MSLTPQLTYELQVTFLHFTQHPVQCQVLSTQIPGQIRSFYTQRKVTYSLI